MSISEKQQSNTLKRLVHEKWTTNAHGACFGAPGA